MSLLVLRLLRCRLVPQNGRTVSQMEGRGMGRIFPFMSPLCDDTFMNFKLYYVTF